MIVVSLAPVIDASSGRLLEIITVPPVHNAEGTLLNDPHGLAVRTLG